MAGMYPENQELSIFGEQVQWPGLDSTGKFTNGSFTNPLEKPSFIPAETLNLILDNLGELIKKLGETPNNAAIDQLANLFTSAPTANKAIMRDEHGRAKVAAPEADDDVARKKEFDDAKTYADGQVLAEAQARVQGDTNTLGSAQSYIDQKFIKHYQKGYLQMPGMPSPLEDTSMHYEGYSWHEVNYDGNFFRAKGRNAKTFSSKKLTKEQIKNGNYIFQNDEQGDAIRNITGSFGQDGSNNSVCFWDKTTITDGAGALRGGQYKNWLRSNSGNYSIHFYGLTFDASRVVPTAEENRPRNLTFIYWVLVKNK